MDFPRKRGKIMKTETINHRIAVALEKYIPDESNRVKAYIGGLIKETFIGLEMEHEENDRTGRPYSSTDNLKFAISVTLDDIDTPMILKEARERA